MPVAAASKIFMVAILLCGTVKALMEDRVLTEDAKCGPSVENNGGQLFRQM
ncbi:unnamed protein product [Notodromas monacha]|uniref:Uncharacterized protein n=1 Tax=Notodromas monacha TaxID=399045 RepID=A0A7R9BUU8_9CRUS|nr:unnamed protein product [Notodromas monacha]CAG0921130.1 unnamed protein product [Notodromas monacha]